MGTHNTQSMLDLQLHLHPRTDVIDLSSRGTRMLYGIICVYLLAKAYECNVRYFILHRNVPLRSDVVQFLQFSTKNLLAKSFRAHPLATCNRHTHTHTYIHTRQPFLSLPFTLAYTLQATSVSLVSLPSPSSFVFFPFLAYSDKVYLVFRAKTEGWLLIRSDQTVYVTTKVARKTTKRGSLEKSTVSISLFQFHPLSSLSFRSPFFFVLRSLGYARARFTQSSLPVTPWTSSSNIIAGRGNAKQADARCSVALFVRIF